MRPEDSRTHRTLQISSNGDQRSGSPLGEQEANVEYFKVILQKS
jgi:hypothetical protein